jgi:hypothetical protein
MGSMMGKGMDMSSNGTFRTYNQILARGNWYVIAFFVGIFLLLRVVEYCQNWSRFVLSKKWEESSELTSVCCRLRSRTRNINHPTKSNDFFEQTIAISTAILHEMSYPQLLLKNRWFSWLSPHHPVVFSSLLASGRSSYI